MMKLRTVTAMREILFRGKRKSDGEWVYGYYVQTNDYLDRRKRNLIFEVNSVNYPRNEIVGTHEVDLQTVGQYTGLIDINGVKIFEGDILSCDDYPYTSDGNQNYYAEIVWLDENAAFGLYTFKNPMSKVRGVSEGCDYIDDFKSDEWEVIGNIYDNPELLGGDTNE